MAHTWLTNQYNTTPLADGRYRVELAQGPVPADRDFELVWQPGAEATPIATLFTERTGAETFAVRAHTATPEEKPRMWRTMTAAWPAYDEYQTKTDREIPVVVLERV